MFNETMVTLQGLVGGEVVLRAAGETQVAKFRVGCTPRRFDKGSGRWVDGPTQWYSVSAWRWLGEHCASSLHKGDPVVVHGRLDARTYINKAGVEVIDHEVTATFVGHDLCRGTSVFTRSRPPASEGQVAA